MILAHRGRTIFSLSGENTAYEIGPDQWHYDISWFYLISPYQWSDNKLFVIIFQIPQRLYIRIYACQYQQHSI